MLSPYSSSQVLEEQSRQLAEAEHIPGTEVTLQKRNSAANGQSAGNDIILVPHPTTDASDPLNWSTRRKGLCIMSVALYTLVTSMCALSMAPMFPLFAETFHLTQAQVPLITGVTIIVLGFANFVVIPFSNIFGRRAAALVFGVLFLVTCIWQAVAKSYGSFLAARAFIGFAAAPSETLMVQVIADIYFVHERGMMVMLYFTAGVLGATIGPVIAGSITERHGWRSFFWLSTGLTAVSVILVLIFVPETKYNRQSQDTGVSMAISTIEPLSEKKMPTTEHVDTPSLFVQRQKGRPTAKQHSLIQPPHPHWKSFLLHDVIVPIRIAFYPIIIFSTLLFTGPANLFLFWNLIESPVLGGPPYNFTPAQVGYSNFAVAIGALLGMAVIGPFSEWISRKLTERNGGVREAEMRLLALVPSLFLVVIGSVVGGLAIERKWPWPVIVVFGFGITGVCLTTVSAVAIAYAVDAYKPVSGEIMVTATVVKNATGFAMTYWMPPMAVQKGYLTPLMVWFTFTVGPMLLAVPFYFWGKRLRIATRTSSVHSQEAIF